MTKTSQQMNRLVGLKAMMKWMLVKNKLRKDKKAE